MAASMEFVTLTTTQGHKAKVYLHGAHVTSWTTPEGQELLFLSKKAVFDGKKAIRGGIPVCFPQFGKMGPMPSQHGFARNVPFEVEALEEWRVKMVLNYDGTSQPSWPHPFKLRIITSLCDNLLTQEMEVINTGAHHFDFTAALHTYFVVPDITQVRITGLHGLHFLDNLASQAQVHDHQQALIFTGEVDRIYKCPPSTVTIHDNASVRVIEVHKETFSDFVVWNPWIDKAAAMEDFGDEEYKEMLCIEPAVAATGHVKLAPGGVWTAKQMLKYAQGVQSVQADMV